MIWRFKPIVLQREFNLFNPWTYRREIPAIPDPDVTDLRRLRCTLDYYKILLKMCSEAGITIKATVIWTDHGR